MLGDLLLGGDAVVEQLVPDEVDRRHLELVARGVADREGGVGRHVDQAGRPEPAGQRAAVGQVDPALGQQRAEAAPQAIGQHLRGSRLLQAAERLQRRVGVLDEEHPAGAEGRHHVGQGRVALGDVDQDEAGVHQVERACRGRVGRDVVLEDLDVGCRRAARPTTG